MAPDIDYVELSVEYLHHTEKAVLVKDGDNEIWIPKSLISDDAPDFDDLERHEAVEIPVAEWFAEEEGLI